MAEPVNLNRFKKTRARAEKKARADQNAVTFGLSKAEKDLQKAKDALAQRDLDGKKRE